jgi:hypothetical protein
MKRTIGTTDQPLDVPYDGTGEGTKGHFWHAAVMACYLLLAQAEASGYRAAP